MLSLDNAQTNNFFATIPSVNNILPKASQDKLSAIDLNQSLSPLQSNISSLSSAASEFAQQQVKTFQIWLIKSVSDRMIQNLQQP